MDKAQKITDKPSNDKPICPSDIWLPEELLSLVLKDYRDDLLKKQKTKPSSENTFECASL